MRPGPPTRWGAVALGHPARILLAPVALAGIFALGVADLWHDTARLT